MTNTFTMTMTTGYSVDFVENPHNLSSDVLEMLLHNLGDYTDTPSTKTLQDMLATGYHDLNALCAEHARTLVLRSKVVYNEVIVQGC